MIICAVAGGALLCSAYLGYGFHETRAKIRAADRLQSEFRTDPRFGDIAIAYVDPPRLKGEWLSVAGTVASEADLAALRGLVDDENSWSVKWKVAVDLDG